jgi:serine/threonine-protein kinase RsbW
MPHDRHPSPIEDPLCLIVESDPMAVRAALERLISGLAARGVPARSLGSVELVLAEALNNVVEHAYAQAAGPIEILLHPAGGLLDCRIRDRGLGMPGGALPDGAPDSLDCLLADLPEGGFGWLLIRELAEGIEYRRIEGQNQLAFRMRIDPASDLPVRALPSRP